MTGFSIENPREKDESPRPVSTVTPALIAVIVILIVFFLIVCWSLWNYVR